jgi:hypothetical protein
MGAGRETETAGPLASARLSSIGSGLASIPFCRNVWRGAVHTNGLYSYAGDKGQGARSMQHGASRGARPRCRRFQVARRPSANCKGPTYRWAPVLRFEVEREMLCGVWCMEQRCGAVCNALLQASRPQCIHFLLRPETPKLIVHHGHPKTPVVRSLDAPSSSHSPSSFCITTIYDRHTLQ